MVEVAGEIVLSTEEALDVFLARIEMNAALLRHGGQPVIGLENVKLFHGAGRLLKELPPDHRLREKYNPDVIDSSLKEIARYYVDIESIYHKPEKQKTA